LELLLRINEQEVISWKGKHRASINKLGVYPRPYQSKLPICLAVGGTPASMKRAGTLNLPVTLAILGSDPDRFVPLVELYRESARKAGHDEKSLPFAINCHFYIADSSEQAADEFFPVYEKMMNRIGKERGWGKLTRDQFEYMRSPKGSLFVGSVQEVIDKVLYQHQLFHHTRFLAQIISGDIPHEKLMHSIRLLGKEVAPVVKEKLKK
jgi:alkanesulfonate monooxygenase SsuD/methylene tetrahydromethanopterin reductase-like flavin-dependent oxidoreductase (luciferase family)